MIVLLFNVCCYYYLHNGIVGVIGLVSLLLCLYCLLGRIIISVALHIYLFICLFMIVNVLIGVYIAVLSSINCHECVSSLVSCILYDNCTLILSLFKINLRIFCLDNH